MYKTFKFFDFHTHLDFYKDNEVELIAEDIIKNKIKIFSASVNIESYKRNIKIRELIINKAIKTGMSEEESSNLVTVTFGVHPSYIKKLPEKENEAIEVLLPFYERSPVISEIGLDFYWEKECPEELQVMHLLIALEEANKQNKVVVLHTKGAEKEIYEILKDFPRVKPVIHWYDGQGDIYKKFIEKGYPQTFGCELKYSERIKEFLKETPDSLILPETDNPTGEPWLGGIDSSPSLIKRIYEDIASEKKWSLDETSEILERNLERLF